MSAVESLLKAGADVNFTLYRYWKQITPIGMAVDFTSNDEIRSNRYKILELLIKHGANLEDRHNGEGQNFQDYTRRIHV